MTRDQAADIFRERLLGDTDFEIAGSDRTTAVGYRVTVRRGDIDLAAFSGIDSAVLRSSIDDELSLSIGATLYRIERSFGPRFFRAARESGRVSGVSITVQSRRKIVCLIGLELPPLADALEAHVPATVEWAPDTLVEESREWGRKVGRAAKDLAGLRESAFGLEHLETLERSGEAEAYEAVRKEAIWPAPTIEALRARGVPPAVAFGIVSCWRMLKQRPARNPALRLAFVRDLPSFRTALENCGTLDEFAAAVGSHVATLAGDASAVVGTRLPRFAQRLNSRGRRYYSPHDTVLAHILAIDAAPDTEGQWALVANALSIKATIRMPAGPSMPARQSLPIKELTRSGPNLPDPPPLTRIPAELGITGLELGNYVTRREGDRLACLLAEAFVDLRILLGDWIVPLCRKGNLSVALGARGKGKGCAHYEPDLRVINLTRSKGDGSLAHEFAHFLDHMISPHAEGESRFLSARVNRPQRADHPIAAGMSQVMQVVSMSSHSECVTGEVNPERWYLPRWIASRGWDPELPPQVSFDRVADRVPDLFRSGGNPRSNSIMLVHSIAKFGNSPVEPTVRSCFGRFRGWAGLVI